MSRITNLNPVSIAPIIAALDDLFTDFNTKFFENALSKPIITISPDRKSFGNCTDHKAWINGVSGYHEISISSYHLNREFEDVCSTLLHEMCHLLNIEQGIVDCSRQGIYHNKNFMKAAKSHGLVATYNGKQGYGDTELAPEVREYAKTLDQTVFSLYRKTQNPKGKKSSSRTYECPMCNTKIRATKDINVFCADCEMPFFLKTDTGSRSLNSESIKLSA